MDWELIISVVIGIVIGLIVSYVGLFFIERWKRNNIRTNWAKNFLHEVLVNRFLKAKEIKFLKEEIENIGHIKDARAFELFSNNFETFFSLLKSGVIFDNKKIILVYSAFITIENSLKIFKEKALFEEYMKITDLAIKSKNIGKIEKLIEISQAQYKRIDMVFEHLIKESRSSKNEIELVLKVPKELDILKTS